MRVLVVTAAGILAAVTAEVPSTYPNTIVAEPAPASFRGLPPRLEIPLPARNEDVDLIYVTRRQAGLYTSSGSIKDFLNDDGKVVVSTLMSLARPAHGHLSRSLMARAGATYSSAIVIRNRSRQTDHIVPFTEIGILKSNAVSSREFSWNGGVGREYDPVNRARLATIIFLGGTDGSVDHLALAAWSALGANVVSLPWVQAGTRTPGCLDSVNLDEIRKKVEGVYEANAGNGPVVLVGHSGGADAALMIANHSSASFQSVHAIAPTAWHFNGDRGPGCSFPASPWTLNGQQVPYILNFPTNWATPVSLFRRALGGVSQNTIALEALSLAGPEKRRAVTYDVRNIRVPTYLYAGRLDDLTPSAATLDVFCGRIQRSHCYVNDFAGHDIFGAPTEAVYCRSPRESLRGHDRQHYCKAMSVAREHVFNTVARTMAAKRTFPSGAQ